MPVGGGYANSPLRSIGGSGFPSGRGKLVVVREVVWKQKLPALNKEGASRLLTDRVVFRNNTRPMGRKECLR